MTMNKKFLLVVGIIIGSLIIVTPVAMTISAVTKIKFTLLENAGVMIESKGVRIYVDPVGLPSEYSELPADAVLITHPHGDHYELLSMNQIQKETTINIFPDNMSDEIAYFDGIGLQPEETITIEHITITAFYMYTFPVGEIPASHPEEANWTSYIIDVNGFSFFHAGDSKNIPEYAQLTGLIDVALLPLGPGCQTMVDMEIAAVINLIQPRYVVPIHYVAPANDVFYDSYGNFFGATYVNLEYFSSHRF